MKKLLLILATGLAFASPAQGMEKIKSIFNYFSTLTINGQKLSDYDVCDLCLQNYKIHPELGRQEFMPCRHFINCSGKHSFHTKCFLNFVENFGPQPPYCPTCLDNVTPDESEYAFTVAGYRGYKLWTFGISALLSYMPFLFLEKICPKEIVEKYDNVVPHIRSIIHSYSTIYLMNKVDTFLAHKIVSTGKLLIPITNVNVKNIALFSASKYLLAHGLDKMENILGKESKLLFPVVGGSYCTAYIYSVPKLLEHKNI